MVDLVSIQWKCTRGWRLQTANCSASVFKLSIQSPTEEAPSRDIWDICSFVLHAIVVSPCLLMADCRSAANQPPTMGPLAALFFSSPFARRGEVRRLERREEDGDMPKIHLDGAAPHLVVRGFASPLSSSTRERPRRYTRTDEKQETHVPTSKEAFLPRTIHGIFLLCAYHESTVCTALARHQIPTITFVTDCFLAYVGWCCDPYYPYYPSHPSHTFGLPTFPICNVRTTEKRVLSRFLPYITTCRRPSEPSSSPTSLFLVCDFFLELYEHSGLFHCSRRLDFYHSLWAAHLYFLDGIISKSHSGIYTLSPATAHDKRAVLPYIYPSSTTGTGYRSHRKQKW